MSTQVAVLSVPPDVRILYQSPRVLVYQGTHAQVRELLGPACADHVITDPPYTAHVHANIRSVNTSNPGAPRVRVWEPGFDALDGHGHVPVLLDMSRRWCLAFCALEDFGNYLDAAGGHWKTGGRYMRSGIWRKQQAAPQLSGDRPANSCEGIAVMHSRGERPRWNGRGKHAYWAHEVPSFVEHGRDRNGEKNHPAQKPAGLMTELISLFASPGECVLDPYAGSGATGAAAYAAGCDVILGDADPKWAEYCAERMRALEDRGQ